MEYGDIDVHKNQSQRCLFTETREMLQWRIHTQRERCAAVFAKQVGRLCQLNGRYPISWDFP